METIENPILRKGVSSQVLVGRESRPYGRVKEMEIREIMNIELLNSFGKLDDVCL